MREWITGRNPVFETLSAHRRQCFRLMLANGVEEKGVITEILKLVKGSNVPVERVIRQRIDSLGGNPQGIALEVAPYPYVDLHTILKTAERREEPPFILILDTLQDPQNLGTLLRSAEAFGVNGVVIPQHRAAGVTPAVVHASSGACEHLLITATNLAQAISEIKQANVWVIGLDAGENAQDIADIRLDGGLAIVVGSEAEGMRPLVRRSCDSVVRLPMAGRIESLNAAVSGSIALYLASRAR
ncbi:MAG: 23S rRNA (guanosine(2251)-2'-O)-methyltransferase RlmB [Leptolinea sp.]|nr:23S rRNA (guanosine(2251)-2'-O)-methyltransferase RlmB [Leptolinea sp.]